MVKIDRHLNPFTPVFRSVLQVDKHQQKQRDNQQRQGNGTDGHDIDKDILADIGQCPGEKISQSAAKTFTGQGRSFIRLDSPVMFSFSTCSTISPLLRVTSRLWAVLDQAPVVGCHHNRRAAHIGFFEDIEDLILVGIIQIAGRFVRQQDLGVVHQGPGQGHTLLFTTGKTLRESG